MVLSKYTNTEYDMGTKKDKITGVGYFKYNDGKDTKIKKKKYQSFIQKYKFKKATSHLITPENIKKYVKQENEEKEHALEEKKPEKKSKKRKKHIAMQQHMAKEIKSLLRNFHFVIPMVGQLQVRIILN